MTNEEKKVLQDEFENNDYNFNQKIYDEITKLLKQQRYGDESKIVDKIIKIFPKNTDLTEVYTKVVIVNTTHTAGVHRIDCIKVAKDIVNFDKFDERLANGDIKLVDELIEQTYKNTQKHQWSFYTKYLTCHNKSFSKYDSFVGKHVKERSEVLGLEKFQTCVGKFYENYYNAITKIIKEDGFQDRQIFDTFIWGLYKEEKE